MRLLLQQQQTSQPQQAVGIDWSNPITRGLVFAYSPSDDGPARNAVNGAIATRSGTSAGSVRKAFGYGFGGRTNASTDRDDFGEPDTLRPDGATPFTWLTVFDHTGAVPGGLSQPMGFGLAGSNNGGYAHRPSATVHRSCVSTGGLQYNALGTSISTLTSGTIVGRADGSNVTHWENGRLIATTACGFPDDLNAGTFVVGNAINGNGYTGYLFCGLVWRRSLSDAEIRSISANPWQVFRRANTRRWSLSVVSVGPPYYPSADVSAGGWTASNGGTLASCIDEATTPNDSDYISSGMATGAAIVGIGPLTAGSWSIKVRSAVSTGTGTLTAKLRDSGSVLDTQTTGVTTTPTTYTLTFTVASTADRISFEVA